MPSWNGIEKAVSLVADFGPGVDAEKFFDSRFRLNGGEVLEKLRTPLRSPDFAPVLQKVRDLEPDALFVFQPSGQTRDIVRNIYIRKVERKDGQIKADGRPAAWRRRAAMRLYDAAQAAADADAAQPSTRDRP